MTLKCFSVKFWSPVHCSAKRLQAERSMLDMIRRLLYTLTCPVLNPAYQIWWFRTTRVMPDRLLAFLEALFYSLDTYGIILTLCMCGVDSEPVCKIKPTLTWLYTSLGPGCVIAWLGRENYRILLTSLPNLTTVMSLCNFDTFQCLGGFC